MPAVYAYHHMIGGTDGARQGLHDFWQRISKEGDKTRNPMDAVFESMNLGMLSSASMFETMTRMLSPYEFNPMNLNPLKDVLKASIDFDKLHHCVDTKLRICATNVRSGKIKIFANGEITPEVLLASACLPVPVPGGRDRRRALLGRRLYGQSGDLSDVRRHGKQRRHPRPHQSDHPPHPAQDLAARS